MIADELTTQTADIVRCDMSLDDILTDPEPEYNPTDSMIATMDGLSSKIGDPGVDAQTKDFAGKIHSTYSACLYPRSEGWHRSISNLSAYVCGLQ